MIQNNLVKSLVEAKKTKVIELKTALDTFEKVGYTYMTWKFSLKNEIITDLNLKNQLLDYTSTNISAIASTKTFNLPVGNKQNFVAGQKFNISGSSNNDGIKTVVSADADSITVVESVIDEATGSNITLSAFDRYKYFDDTNVQRDFVNKAGVEALQSAVITEKDRIIIKNNNYLFQINAATTIAEIDAITIDFSA